MQLKDPNLHQRLQEMCDCYLDTDFSRQMSAMAGSRSVGQEEAVKYLSLAIMYGVTEKASKLSIKNREGEISARLRTAEGKVDLPPPTKGLFEGILALVRSILHFERGGGVSPLSLGLRNSQLDLQVKLKEREGKASLKIEFPELGG